MANRVETSFHNFLDFGLTLMCIYFSENYEITEAKTFFKDNYSHIYYIFFDNFVTVEADLKQRGNETIY